MNAHADEHQAMNELGFSLSFLHASHTICVKSEDQKQETGPTVSKTTWTGRHWDEYIFLLVQLIFNRFHPLTIKNICLVYKRYVIFIIK